MRSGSPLLAATDGTSIAGLVVTVVGTNITSGIDAAGRFNLTGVPAGDVQLKFSAPGMDATVRISPVQASETVTLTVNVGAGAVVVEAEARSTSSEEQIEGRIESLPPTTAPGTVRVAGRTVMVQPSTRIEHGGAARTFDALQVGMRVHVTGSPSGGEVLASFIRIQNTNTWVPVQLNGVVDSLAGSASLFQFAIGSRVVKGDDLTQFFGAGGAGSFTALKNDARVEVKGQQRDGYIYAERIHVNGTTDGGEDEGGGGRFEIQGSVGGLRGTCPALSFNVNGFGVRTDAATAFEGVACAALRSGDKVAVNGTVQTDGAVLATTVER